MTSMEVQMSFKPSKHKRQHTRKAANLWAAGQGFGQAWLQAMAWVPWKRLWILFKGHLFPSLFPSSGAEIMPRRVGCSLALLQLLKAMVIWGRGAREGPFWDCTETGTGPTADTAHQWLIWGGLSLNFSLARWWLCQQSVTVTLQPLIILALGGKCSCLCWTCFWATQYSVLRCNFASVAFYPIVSSLTSAALENKGSSLSVLLPFTILKAVFSLPSFLFHMSGPCCYPLVFLQLVINLSHGDKVSNYLHDPHVHDQKTAVRHNVDQCIRNLPVLSSLLQGRKHY